MAGFNGGGIFGPAIGGALAHAVGPANTCFVVGGAIAGSALLASRLVPETRGIHEIGEPGLVETQSAGDVVRELWTTWNSETSHELRRLCVANLAFFATIAGADQCGNTPSRGLTGCFPRRREHDDSAIGAHGGHGPRARGRRLALCD